MHLAEFLAHGCELLLLLTLDLQPAMLEFAAHLAFAFVPFQFDPAFKGLELVLLEILGLAALRSSLVLEAQLSPLHRCLAVLFDGHQGALELGFDSFPLLFVVFFESRFPLFEIIHAVLEILQASLGLAPPAARFGADGTLTLDARHFPLQLELLDTRFEVGVARVQAL